ncbi:hypothetical protein EB796_011384 [Bugula neritina]|uniref:Uncharacterized protein n=1 Tax=Bugula neritina TaxID=10212 RepID=A0A7J7JX59_BUGNE|nr:hypothetical protein EB796_011384 [Bugula neritina]
MVCWMLLPDLPSPYQLQDSLYKRRRECGKAMTCALLDTNMRTGREVEVVVSGVSDQGMACVDVATLLYRQKKERMRKGYDVCVVGYIPFLKINQSNFKTQTLRAPAETGREVEVVVSGVSDQGMAYIDVATLPYRQKIAFGMLVILWTSGW